MQIRIMLVVCLLVLIFLSLYWSVVLVQLLFVFSNTCLCLLVFVSLYLSVVTGSIPVGVLNNTPGWAHLVIGHIW